MLDSSQSHFLQENRPITPNPMASTWNNTQLRSHKIVHRSSKYGLTPYKEKHILLLDCYLIIHGHHNKNLTLETAKHNHYFFFPRASTFLCLTGKLCMHPVGFEPTNSTSIHSLVTIFQKALWQPSFFSSYFFFKQNQQIPLLALYRKKLQSHTVPFLLSY